MSCEGCFGNGVRDEATPTCVVELPIGWRVVERCDTCERFSNDLAASLSVATRAKWIRCVDGGNHVIAKGKPL